MIKLGMGRSDPVLELHDPEIETEDVINLVLGISIHHVSVFDHSAALRVKAIKFVRKYDMEIEIRLMCGQAHLYHGGQHWTVEGILDHFIFAFQLELYELCRHMVLWTGPLWARDPRSVIAARGYGYGSYLSNKVHPFILHSLSVEQYQRIPAEIAWVLTRANLDNTGYLQGVEGEPDWLDIAGCFEDAIPGRRKHRESIRERG
jgi:hypothetical protein